MKQGYFSMYKIHTFSSRLASTLAMQSSGRHTHVLSADEHRSQSNRPLQRHVTRQQPHHWRRSTARDVTNVIWRALQCHCCVSRVTYTTLRQSRATWKLRLSKNHIYPNVYLRGWASKSLFSRRRSLNGTLARSRRSHSRFSFARLPTTPSFLW